MVFSSIFFLFYFLPIVLVVYYLSPSKFKNIVLLLSSLLFYFYGEPKYVLLMISIIIITYIFGILINNYRKQSKLLLVISIIIITGNLIYFKYINFIVENINFFISNKLDFVHLALPIGISFYTFQVISYLIDIYIGKAKVQKNILKLAMYVSLFPQLIAGPIVRYTTIENQIDKREYSFKKFSNGIRRFIIGLGKKVLIANILGVLINKFLATYDNSVLFYWLYAISGMLQIYFDFSGYSDMAIGIGKMFGFEFLENFNYPYIAKSITDFWRRWHISLSTWFRDYIYIPLGGNRVSTLKWIRNILVVWFLTGLWHGAQWNFIIWGLYFGILLILEKIILQKYLNKIPKIFTRIYTLIIVMISFIVFNNQKLSETIKCLEGLIGINTSSIISDESIYYLKSYFVVLLIGIIGATPAVKMICSKIKPKGIKNLLDPIFLLFIFIISTSYIIDDSFNPFLYFRF